MRNVYDIKQEENLNFVLSDKYINNLRNNISKKEMAVIIHLHYEDTVCNYFKYISNIPPNIDIYITVSNKLTKDKIKQYIDEYGIRNITILDKINRGRDVSALLVTCRSKILEYKYICFLHDKKEKSIETKNDIQIWTEGLWENTIGSKEYIYNIKEFFDKHEKLGVLVPPNPVTEQFSFAITNTWYKNFDLSKSLASELELICDLDKDKPPITLGTVFWCRVAALKKLFIKEWKYEDFPEEPLDADGTISHSIERILAYVAQDAGYYTGNVMTDTYAGKQFEQREKILTKVFEELNIFSGIESLNELYNANLKREKIENFCNSYSDIYIYGAGVYGSKCFRMMQSICRTPKAFIVSDGNKVKEQLYRIPILELSKINLNNKCGIILAVGSKHIDEIIEAFEKKQFDNIMIYIND